MDPKFIVSETRPHVIIDTRTGIEFAIYAPWEVGDKPDPDRAIVLCEYMNEAYNLKKEKEHADKSSPG